MSQDLIKALEKTTSFKEKYIKNVLELLEDKNTVPFIARYRKEMTGGMNEEDIKLIADEYNYMESLQKRKEEVIRLIDEQGMLTEELKAEINKQTVLNRVEDLYRPFKQKKKTKATEAKRKGLEPLAKIIQAQDDADVHQYAERHLNDEVPSVEEAISGALDIIAEDISDEPKFRRYILKVVKDTSSITSTKKKNAEDDNKVFEIYYDYEEPVKKIVPHRVLAINRGEQLKVLNVKLVHDFERLKNYIGKQVIREESKTREYMERAVEDSLKRLIIPSIDREVRNDLTVEGEAHAVDIFEENLKRLLLQPPLKGRMILGVDPAFRSGCKLAVINDNGEFQDKSIIYPHTSKKRVEEAKNEMLRMIKKHDVSLIAIGNGTASRETELFTAELLTEENLDVPFIIVNEAGASVYSASQIARDEFPDFNVEERSAVSIARRVQDPLSELVKIDPKSIGVGQYQHDVNQKYLTESLNFVVETSVNQVGVNVNTASVTLLEHVAGLSPSISKNIVNYRLENGRFKNRREIGKVPRLGKKTYEQCIGFLRLPEGEELLDRTPIHPEQYETTNELLKQLGIKKEQIGSDETSKRLEGINIKEYAEKLSVGEPTLEDIVESLKSPTRDIRDDYETPMLKSNVLKMEDLKQGMRMSGTVRNVTDFGAFVDIGVKQDGLVHVSQLADRFIKHPLEAVGTGDIVEVKVLDVDLKKGRISLTMKNMNN
ncbi:Tex family protein [Salinicoccus halitifaciens]|uniref:S1 motif domain-containing protein n=1 Tax=Salinicoccus halitifaciens TaxID=1073415 RepID=A0ABV2E966_9STAP|nr:Tex family protein [Salinicoccus halitifaciens]MCD2138089.1 RNA-binding transcriptional accessory protein [Salinicoccus halitifaciens]